MTNAASTQLNVRMEPELKASGDAVLREFGISPSQMVRAVWKAVSQGGDALKRIVEVLEDSPATPAAQTAVTDPEDAAARGTKLFGEACSQLGISGTGYVPDTRLWREMREEAIEGRLSERGIL